MADFPSRADLFEVGKGVLLAGNSLLDPAAIDVEGHPANIIVQVGASMAEEVARAGSVLERSLYLDTAGGVGDATLDALVWDRYGLVRQGAAPSLGSVTMTRPSAAAGAVSVPAGTVLVSTGGVRFETTETATFGTGGLGPVTVGVRSALAGAGQRATAGTITAFAESPEDASIQVTNAETTAGDADAETNEELVDRARRYFSNAARGTLSAIEYGARQVPGIRFAVATELTNLAGEPIRAVKVQVADRLGECSAALSMAVRAELMHWRPCGMSVQVVAASVTYVEVVIGITTKSGFDAGAVADQVRAAIVARLAHIQPGETLYHHVILSAAKSVTGALVGDDAVTEPETALAAASGQVYRTKPGLVTVTASA